MAWARSFSALASFLSFASCCCVATLSARDADAPWMSAWEQEETVLRIGMGMGIVIGKELTPVGLEVQQGG